MALSEWLRWERVTTCLGNARRARHAPVGALHRWYALDEQLSHGQLRIHTVDEAEWSLAKRVSTVAERAAPR